MKITEIRTTIENLFVEMEREIKEDIKDKFGGSVEVAVKCYDIKEPSIYYLKIESTVDEGSKNYFCFFVAENKYTTFLPVWEINTPIEIKEYIKNKYL